MSIRLILVLCMIKVFEAVIVRNLLKFRQTPYSRNLLSFSNTLSEEQQLMQKRRIAQNASSDTMSPEAAGIEVDDTNADTCSSRDGSDDVTSELGSRKKKFRQHVNPLASAYQLPVDLPTDWIQNIFENPNQPFVLDVGCSKGSWALNMCKTIPNINVVGLEIRRPVVEWALRRKQRECEQAEESGCQLRNLHYVATNANIDIDRVLRDINSVSYIEMIAVQFPDPHFKKHHKKRRVITTSFVSSVASGLQQGAKFFVQADVKDVLEDMARTITENGSFDSAPGYSIDNIETNVSPVSIQTEREISVRARDLPVYRMLFLKK
jgi:tRNA (guanine-N7-)-methyltransferase